MVARQSGLHDLNGLEALGVLWCQLELGAGGTDSQDTRLRGVDDSREVVDTEHAQVGDGECTALVLLRLELALSGLSSELLGLGRDRGETLGTDVLDDRRDQTSWRGNGNANIGLLVPRHEVNLAPTNAIRLTTHCLIVSPSQAELASGTSAKARAEAFTTGARGQTSPHRCRCCHSLKSLTESLVLPSPALLNISRSFMTRSEGTDQPLFQVTKPLPRMNSPMLTSTVR